MSLSEPMEKLLSTFYDFTARSDQHTHINIKEKQDNAKLRNVTLVAKDFQNWFSFTPETGEGVMSPLLAKGKEHKHHCSCDCVIFVNFSDRLGVIYIDLKSKSPNGAASQFKSTRQFIKYVLELLNEFHGIRFPAMTEGYLVLYGGSHSINKAPTVPKWPKGGISTPDSPITISIPDNFALSLKTILGYISQEFYQHPAT
ncbi:hypothetical protein [Leeia sp.]|uniref:hypothetical protein n=1 Tax=Leeia sp. TaxID=2884678 RepID=UPI0035B458BB